MSLSGAITELWLPQFIYLFLQKCFSVLYPVLLLTEIIRTQGQWRSFAFDLDWHSSIQKAPHFTSYEDDTDRTLPSQSLCYKLKIKNSPWLLKKNCASGRFSSPTQVQLHQSSPLAAAPTRRDRVYLKEGKEEQLGRFWLREAWKDHSSTNWPRTECTKPVWSEPMGR